MRRGDCRSVSHRSHELLPLPVLRGGGCRFMSVAVLDVDGPSIPVGGDSADARTTAVSVSCPRCPAVWSSVSHRHSHAGRSAMTSAVNVRSRRRWRCPAPSRDRFPWLDRRRSAPVRPRAPSEALVRWCGRAVRRPVSGRSRTSGSSPSCWEMRARRSPSANQSIGQLGQTPARLAFEERLVELGERAALAVPLRRVGQSSRRRPTGRRGLVGSERACIRASSWRSTT